MSKTIDPARQEDDVDGIIYFDPTEIPNHDVLGDEEEFTADETHPYQIELDADTNTLQRTLYERRLASWKDITTPPKTKAKCSKMIKVGPLKTCRKWKAYAKWLYRTANLRVTTSTPVDIGSAVEDCIKQAAIAAAVTAIVSGGSAAAAVAEKLFYACLSKKLGSELLSVTVEMKSKWGEWSRI